MTHKRNLIVFLVLLLTLSMAVGCGTSTVTNERNESASNQNSQQANGSTTTSEDPAQSKTNFPEKNITYIVPVSPGGGFDTLSRMFIPYWEKNLPNDHKILVENMPGAEWTIGLNELYRAKPDGYTIGILNLPGNITEQLLGRAKYDLTEYVPIGRISDIAYILAASKASGIETLEDLQAKDNLKIGVAGLASTAGIGAIIASERFGLDVTPVPHDGSNEAVLSTIRGITDFTLYSYGTLGSFIKSGDLVPVMVFADERLPNLPDVPTSKELGYGDLNNVVQMHRIVAAPPGTPDDVIQVLRESFETATQDPEFAEKMIEIDGDYNPGDAEMAQEIIQNALQEFEAYTELILQYRN